MAAPGSAPLGRALEDGPLVQGTGLYAADLPAGDALHAVFLRSMVAAAEGLSIDADAAREMPGVAAVFTAEDLAADGVGPVQVPMALTGPEGEVWESTPRPLLAAGNIRFVGEPLAIVVATTRAEAMDAAEAIGLDWIDRAAVIGTAAALAEGAALVHDGRPGNIGYRWAAGDRAGVDAALAESAHVVRMQTRVTRVTAVPMEPRAATAAPLPDGRWELFPSHQAPQGLRGSLAAAFGLPAEQIRVRTGHVGGSFGMKAGPLREEMVLFWAARRLGRPVRWQADRADSFLSDEAGRDLDVEAALGLDAEGRFTALSVELQADIGAYASARSLPPVLNFGGVAGPYTTPVIFGAVTGVLSNSVPVAAYRGAGRPEATFVMERLVDLAARQTGIDPVELRRRNLIPAAAMPWKSPFLFDYDSGDFARVLDAGLAQAGVAGFPARRLASEAKGLLRGLGVAFCIETAGGPYNTPGRDHALIEIDGEGRLRVGGGSFSAGQGMATTLIRLAAERLGLPTEGAIFVQGDTDLLPEGRGMGGSSGTLVAGSAVLEASTGLIATARALAAAEMDAAPETLEFDEGTFRLPGSNRSMTLAELGRLAAGRGTPLLARGSFKPEQATFPNGCHVCEVEIDPETGQVAICSYSAVEDVGRVLNPQLAEGQLHGGIAQALGQVLAEEVRLSDDGQVLSGSFMDYAMPRATDLPVYRTGFESVPTALNPLGVKGVGEAGSVGGLAAGMNAVCDALAGRGVRDFAMPATPLRVWEALQAAAQEA
ncbi:xanthine dehydrogenase family protein molybdopterin-binding subunit [Frigidibacter sp. MR17.14]|uniref:xanthine dehydrogenase family protein molybdopterin-binding subunit n=1 Tax=Frigidibacter sp. MR17.14 TaxID=3126509 RepID=UPI003012E851